MARLERRFGFLSMASFLAAAAGVFLIYLARGGYRNDSATAATVVTAQLPPPTPTQWVEQAAAPDRFAGDMGMMGAAGGMMGALFHELSTLKQLRDEGIISKEDWQAKKAESLEEELNPADLRSDLQLVPQLSDAGAICGEERAALRARLLGINCRRPRRRASRAPAPPG